ncbi:hypothetical protein AX16_000853 [Volvariella volvacea WC 439]|nr:hypothetical protein AX16_000853 [Volvariella volvacea WC 439]
MNDILAVCKIISNRSIAYHPQTNRQVERINAEITKYLQLYSNHAQNDWAEWLSVAQAVYNNRPTSSTEFSPTMINLGREPNDVQFSPHQFKREDAQLFKEDENKKPEREYQSGEKVWLSAANIRTTRLSRKLANRKHGPFEVLEKIGAVSYRLRLPEEWSLIHNVFHYNLLTPYIGSTTPQQQFIADQHQPAPVLVENQPEYEIKELYDQRHASGKWQYHAKWKGWSHDFDSWIPVNDLEHAVQLLRDFHQKQPNTTIPHKIKQ